MTNVPTPTGLKHIPAYTDNRDFRTTILVLEDGSQVEIDPVALFIESLENREVEGSVYFEVQKYKNPDNTHTLQLSLVFETGEEHDEDSDVEILQFKLQNDPKIVT